MNPNFVAENAVLVMQPFKIFRGYRLDPWAVGRVPEFSRMSEFDGLMPHFIEEDHMFSPGRDTPQAVQTV
jgi:hypothetical protein